MQSQPEILSMRTKYFLLVLPILLGGCTITKKEEKIDVSDIVIPEADHEYFEVEQYFINWENILEQNNEAYYVYFYSLTCSHCQELKNWIVERALARGDVYFVKGSNKDIIRSDVSNTVGVTSADDIAIMGYPSLIKIVNKTVTINAAGNTKIMELLK